MNKKNVICNVLASAILSGVIIPTSSFAVDDVSIMDLKETTYLLLKKYRLQDEKIDSLNKKQYSDFNLTLNNKDRELSESIKNINNNILKNKIFSDKKDKKIDKNIETIRKYFIEENKKQDLNLSKNTNRLQKEINTTYDISNKRDDIISKNIETIKKYFTEENKKQDVNLSSIINNLQKEIKKRDDNQDLNNYNKLEKVKRDINKNLNTNINIKSNINDIKNSIKQIKKDNNTTNIKTKKDISNINKNINSIKKDINININDIEKLREDLIKRITKTRQYFTEKNKSQDVNLSNLREELKNKDMLIDKDILSLRTSIKTLKQEILLRLSNLENRAVNKITSNYTANNEAINDIENNKIKIKRLENLIFKQAKDENIPKKENIVSKEFIVNSLLLNYLRD